MHKRGIRGLLGLVVCMVWAGQIPASVICPAGQAGLFGCAAPVAEPDPGCCAQPPESDAEPERSPDPGCCPDAGTGPARANTDDCCCIQAGPSRPVERESPLPQFPGREAPVQSGPEPGYEIPEPPPPGARLRPHPAEPRNSGSPRSPPLI